MEENNKKKSTYAAGDYATKEELNREARIRADNDDELRDTIQALSDDYEDFKENGGGSGGVSRSYVDQQDALKQNITDNTLTTTDKTVPGAINELVTNKVDKTYVDTGLNGKQDTLISGTNIKTINNQSLLGSGNLDISNSGDVTKEYVDQQDALKQNITDNSLATTNKTVPGAINELVTNKTDKTYVDNQDATKQNTLVDTGAQQNIKTINNQSILGTGNLDISSSGSTPLDNNIEIYDNESNNFVQYKMNLNWDQASTNSLTSKSYVDTQDTSITNSVNLKADKTYVDSQDATKQNITDNSLTTANKTVPGAINELNTIKQNTLVDNGAEQNIKTINNQTILGIGNLEISGSGDVTKEYVDQQDALKQNITDNSLTTTDKTIVGGINELVTNKTDKTYVDNQDALKADKTYVDSQDATKQNTLVDTGAEQNIKTINNQSILGIGNLDISGSGSTPLDNNIEIYDNESNNFVAYKMDPLDWSKANDKSLPNKKYVDDQDTLKADKTYVDSQDATKQNTLVDNGAEQNIKTINNQTILGIGNLEISGSGDVTKDYVDQQDALKQDITDNNLTTTDKTVVGGINELVTNKTDKTYVDNQNALKADKTYVDTQDATKQNTLVDTGAQQNIKTINNQSILGIGNLDISGSGSTPLDNNIEIYDNESNNFVAYKMDPLDWSKANDKSLPNKKYVDDQDTLKADKAYVDSQDATKQNTLVSGSNIKTINSQSLLGAGDLVTDSLWTTATSGSIPIVILQDQNQTLSVTSAQITSLENDSINSSGVSNFKIATMSENPNEINDLTNKKYVDSGLATKQDALVSGTNIKTINSESILGTGNIDISGSGSTPLDNNIEIYDNESNNFVAYKMDPLDWSKANDKSLPNKKYVDDQDTLKADKTYVDTQDATKQNTLVDTGAEQNIKTINNQSILGTGNIDISGSGDVTKDYVDQQDALKQNITDNTLTTTDKTIPGAINELVTNKTDKTYVDSQNAIKQDKTDNSLNTTNKTIVGGINELVTNKANTSDVENGLDAKQDILISGTNIKTINNQSILGIGNIDISSDGDVTKDYVDQQDALKQNITDNTLTTTDKTVPGAINELVTNKTDKTYVDSQDATKQNTLVDTGAEQNIKTINNQSILGTGNIDISGSGDVTKDYVDQQDALKQNITDNTLTTTDKTIPGAINELVTNKADKTYVDSQNAIKQDKTDNSLNTTNKTIVGGINELVTNKANTSDMENELDAKQDTLISGTNIKTINNQSILGIGNIDISSDSDVTKDYVDQQDALKQNITDNTLTTTDKTVPGAINELVTNKTDKTYVDNQDALKADKIYVDSQDATKQDKTDNSLNTTNKTVVGAINELVTNKSDKTYVDNQDALKQNITDNSLTTTNKTIVGGINELVTNKVDKIYVDNQDALKQNTLVDTGAQQNIKTINNQSILGTGNIDISSDGDATKDYVDQQDALKQNITDNSLTTTDKTVPGAINELVTNKADKTYVDNQNALKADKTYVDTQDATKQDKTDNSLNTTNKTVVGAINELATNKSDKTYVDNQDVLKQNITDNTLTTTDKTVPGAINELVTNKVDQTYVDNQNALKADKTYVDTQDATKQDKTDNSLNTTNKTVIGGINELVANKADKTYVDNQDALKQNITDNTLTTTDKTVSGAINELVTNKVDQTYVDNQNALKADKTYVDTQDALKQNITDNNLNTEDKTIVEAINELEMTKADYAYVDAQSTIKQNKTDNTLTTTNKTIVGAINELVTNKADKTYVDTQNTNLQTQITTNASTITNFKYTLTASSTTSTSLFSFPTANFDKTKQELRVEISLFDDDSTATTNNRSCSVSWFFPNTDLTTNYGVQVVDRGNTGVLNTHAITTMRLRQNGTNFEIQLFQSDSNASTNTISFTGIYVYKRTVL